MFLALRIMIIMTTLAVIPTLAMGLYYLAAAEVLLIITPYVKSMKMKVKIEDLEEQSSDSAHLSEFRASYAFWQSLLVTQVFKKLF